MSSALHELLTMLALAAGGVAGAWMLGARSVKMLLATGTLFAATWRWLSLILVDSLGVREISFFAWLVPLVLVLGIAVVIGWRERRLWAAIGSSVTLALVSVGLTRGLLWAGRPHSDSNWILAMSDALQSNSVDLTALGGRVVIKRGFAYPAMLALGPEGEQLTGFTPYLWLVLIFAIWWLARSSIGATAARKDKWLLGGVTALLAGAALSAIMPLRSVLYVNGHTLFALAAVVVLACSISAIKQSALLPYELVAICMGLATISITRPEGIVFAAVLALPLISRSWLSRWQVAVLVSSASVSLFLWIVSTDWTLIQSLGAVGVGLLVILLLGGVIISLPWLDAIRVRLTLIAAWVSIVVTLALAIWLNAAFLPGLASLWQNLGPANEGRWGYILLAFIPAVILIGLKQISETYRVLLTTSLLLIFSTLASKLLDGAQVFEVSLGRVGWSDSVNRMWIHSFAILWVTLLVGMFERGRQLFGQELQKPAKKEVADS